jgi:alcohol dehydrogenase YqhD (iron-dependent ADH family)
MKAWVSGVKFGKVIKNNLGKSCFVVRNQFDRAIEDNQRDNNKTEEETIKIAIDKTENFFKQLGIKTRLSDGNPVTVRCSVVTS